MLPLVFLPQWPLLFSIPRLSLPQQPAPLRSRPYTHFKVLQTKHTWDYARETQSLAPEPSVCPGFPLSASGGTVLPAEVPEAERGAGSPCSHPEPHPLRLLSKSKIHSPHPLDPRSDSGYHHPLPEPLQVHALSYFSCFLPIRPQASEKPFSARLLSSTRLPTPRSPEPHSWGTGDVVVFEPRDESVKVMEVPAPQAQTQLRAKRCPRDVPPGRRCAPWFSRTSAEWWGQR